MTHTGALSLGEFLCLSGIPFCRQRQLQLEMQQNVLSWSRVRMLT